MPPLSGFDKLARPYRWMEYLSFGPLLQRCRQQFLPEMAEARHALVLGDGDGRFIAALLRAVPSLHAHAVDASAGMLAALRQRVLDTGAAGRLEMTCADANQVLPEGSFDLVCTHFFLDCLVQDEMAPLIARVRHRVPAGMWVISEFAVPKGVLRGPAALLVRGLYLAFGVLTGLPTRELPAYAAAMRANGFTLLCCRERLGGILRAELWQIQPDPPQTPNTHPAGGTTASPSAPGDPAQL